MKNLILLFSICLSCNTVFAQHTYLYHSILITSTENKNEFQFISTESTITIKGKTVVVKYDGKTIKLKCYKKIPMKHLDFFDFIMDFYIFKVKDNRHGIKKIDIIPNDNGQFQSLILTKEKESLYF